MANINVWTLRLITGKTLLGVSYVEFEVLQEGQEQLQVEIPEEDMPIFMEKYKFNVSGDLIISAKTYYILDFAQFSSLNSSSNQ